MKFFSNWMSACRGMQIDPILHKTNHPAQNSSLSRSKTQNKTRYAEHDLRESVEYL